MTKQELVIKVLEDMGLKPQIDEDGDVQVRYQMKHFYVMGTRNEEITTLMLLYNQFFEVEDGEEIKVLTICNKLTRELNITKVYIDRTLKDVSASYEFRYFDEDSLRDQLKTGLHDLTMVRPAFRQELNELNEE